MVADEPGLGKSLQAAAYTTRHHYKTLVVCPAYLKYNWEAEIEKFTYAKSLVIESDNLPTPMQIDNTEILIINYDIIHCPRILSLLSNTILDCIVCDESHYLMNLKAKRTRATMQLVRLIPRKIFLSGTPVKARPSQFFTQLNALHPEIRDFADYKVFRVKYCGREKIHLGKKAQYNENCLTELHTKIKPFYIRRLKKDVLKELPAKQWHPILIKLTALQQEAYQTILNSDRYPNPLVKITVAKQYLANAKTPLITQKAIDTIELEKKVAIFSQYVNVLELYKKIFREKAVMHRGQMTGKERQANVKAFQEDPNITTFLGNIITAAGYTITAAHTTLVNDLLWDPADHDQMSDRQHRIGQKFPVNVYFFLYRNTIETQIYELLCEKRKVTELVQGDRKGKLNTIIDIRQEIMDSIETKNYLHNSGSRLE